MMMLAKRAVGGWAMNKNERSASRSAGSRLEAQQWLTRNKISVTKSNPSATGTAKAGPRKRTVVGRREAKRAASRPNPRLLPKMYAPSTVSAKMHDGRNRKMVNQGSPVRNRVSARNR
jgi:hypothetical protein